MAINRKPIPKRSLLSTAAIRHPTQTLSGLEKRLAATDSNRAKAENHSQTGTQ
ncbi:hypothetical protein CV_3962 [Chromobacterium violaceum ATCC 12472]|uniref:Uncharacterized protein n=1 Tax=Chromobacterium violaceum (strain ATCC 12472 / DSM 30191 / JCM 1249 / CCUG 213 / NBRC 12614 / NCIMB 9131 / NCTC 9757 / MK) TaxID=243365 RepID=Q7NR23_CHRVO|nr:hypothetical protein CV_3962 [Chromobacterium violaceum ATCC 12472]